MALSHLIKTKMFNKISESFNLASQLIGQAKISHWILKEAHDKFNPQDPLHSIVNPAHGNDIILYLERQIINKHCEVIWDHDLQVVRDKNVS